jgi:DNA-binding Xre family transcriptional regulator
MSYRSNNNDITRKVVNPIRKNIAYFIEKERKQRGLNPYQMWLRLRGDDEGLARPTYLDTVSCKNNITFRTLESLADKLDASIADLFGVKGPTPLMRSYKADDLHKRLADFVEMERVARKMLRTEIAAKIGVSYPTYRRIMNHTGNMAIDTVAGIAKSLRVDPTTFLFKDHNQ